MIADKAAAEIVSSDAGHLVLDGYISEDEYARQRGVSVRTCQRERALRKSAPYVLLGKKVFYRVAAVREWLLAQERTFEQQAFHRRSQAPTNLQTIRTHARKRPRKLSDETGSGR